jgi:hypothetical protein
MNICLPCIHRQRVGTCTGPCLCYFDPANPVDLRERRKSGCPLGLKPIPIREPKEPGAFAPGNVADWIISKLGYQPVSSCSCKAFQAQMNEWGWIGCARHWRRIMGHFWREWTSPKE